MRPRALVTLAAAICLALPGCTVRFSQSLVGSIAQDSGAEVRSSDSGFALFGIVIEEPKPAHEQVQSLMDVCPKLSRVEVDYRELWFILFGMPEITVTAKCTP
jgi:hypothetical protein